MTASELFGTVSTTRANPISCDGQARRSAEAVERQRPADRGAFGSIWWLGSEDKDLYMMKNWALAVLFAVAAVSAGAARADPLRLVVLGDSLSAGYGLGPGEGFTDQLQKARPMHPDWQLATRDYCSAHGIAYFFKQWGEWLPWEAGSPPEWESQNGQREDHHALFP
ncbi:MAG: DUF5131 family protein, partial [Rhizobiales bacterium]|nr:DUF5131 family protein [Hyphomicrobiales bacterium]